jgi:thiol-disulfide isomerase/thioredoxin
MKNDWFKLLLTGFALTLCHQFLFAQKAVEGYEIKIKLTDYTQDTLFLGYQMGNQTFIRDTAVVDKATKTFTFSKPKKMSAGIYLMVMPPDNNYFQIIVNDDEQNFTLTTSSQDFYKDGKVTGSKDCELFYSYMRYIAEKGNDAKKYSELKQKDAKLFEEKMKNLDAEVRKYQDELIKKNPKSITAMVIKSTHEVDVPEFTEIADSNKRQMARYLFYKDHFFDNYSLDNPAMHLTPVLFSRVDMFMEKMTPQHPDSINTSLEHILEKMKPSKEMFQWYFIHYLNKYAKSNLVGFDAVYVNLAKKYIETGFADDFIAKENREKIVQNANKLFPILIGKRAPEIKVFKEDNSTISVSDVKAKYTVLFFFAPDCGHCQKQSPALVEFLQKAKEKKWDVKVMAVCTYVGTEKMPECWKYAQEKGFGDFINAVDPYLISRYKTLYNVETTPQLYVLDENKIIRSKSIEAKQLEDVIDNLIKEDSEKIQKAAGGR